MQPLHFLPLTLKPACEGLPHGKPGPQLAGIRPKGRIPYTLVKQSGEQMRLAAEAGENYKTPQDQGKTE